jgi:hypothetical protein
VEIPKEELRFSRLFYDSCNSGPYYLSSLAHGIVFYSVSSAEGLGALIYLRGHMEGKTDEELYALVQEAQPKYDYYNFNKYPWEQ